MRDPMRTITFGITETPSDIFGLSLGENDEESDVMITEETGSVGSIITGTYEYESEPLFGSQTTADGELYWDSNTELVAIVTYHDRPKEERLFETISEGLDDPISAPEYPQEASAQFYRTFGFNGYTTSFREDLRDYGIDSSFQYIEPDERMEESAMHSRRNPSDEWLEEITNDLIEDGYYVASMDCMLEENGDSLSFSNPMRITGISNDYWSDELLEIIFTRMNELYTNTVPTIDEVVN